MTTNNGPGAFGVLLKQYRAAAGLSQEELAERAGLSRRGISDLERGQRRSPHLLTARRLAESLELDRAQRAALFASVHAATATPVATSPAADLGNDGQARHNLPVQLTSLVGRVHEIADVRRELARTRLLTLAGPGGVGKTRLALAVVELELRSYPDGVWFVDLAPLQDAALVPHQVATVLQVGGEAPQEELIQTLIWIVQPRRLLLILDNCEHVLAACVDLVSALLRHCPHLRVLTTSREVLGIGAEMIWRVPPLRLPQAFASGTPEQVTSSESAALFVERARTVRSDFAVTSQNAAILAAVCRRLDGIPLAIELAAARLRLLTLEQIADRLGEHVRLLATRDPTVPLRQQTLQATIDWSYRLLSDLERRLFNRLVVFAGGWTLEAAEAVCSNEGLAQSVVLDLLGNLVDQSLVVAEAGPAQMRYRLLETLWQYAHAQLVESGEESVIRQRHATYFLALAEETEPHVRGSQEGIWLDHVEREYDNFRAAVRASLNLGDAETALRITAALPRFWESRGSLYEAQRWVEQALSHPAAQRSPVRVRARALSAAGRLAVRRHQHKQAAQFLELSLALFRTLGDTREVAWQLTDLGIVAMNTGEHERAMAIYQECFALWRTLGEPLSMAIVLNNMGEVARRLGDYGRARTQFERSLNLCRNSDEPRGVARALGNLGRVACDLGDDRGAVALLEESAALYRQLGIAIHLPANRLALATAHLHLGETERAARLLAEALPLSRELGVLGDTMGCLEALSRLASWRSEQQRAIRLLSAAALVREQVGHQLPPAERDDYEHHRAGLRSALGESAFAAEWAAGHAMSLQAAIDEGCAAADAATSAWSEQLMPPERGP